MTTSTIKNESQSLTPMQQFQLFQQQQQEQEEEEEKELQDQLIREERERELKLKEREEKRKKFGSENKQDPSETEIESDFNLPEEYNEEEDEEEENEEANLKLNQLCELQQKRIESLEKVNKDLFEKLNKSEKLLESLTQENLSLKVNIKSFESLSTIVNSVSTPLSSEDSPPPNEIETQKQQINYLQQQLFSLTQQLQKQEEKIQEQEEDNKVKRYLEKENFQKQLKYWTQLANSRAEQIKQLKDDLSSEAEQGGKIAAKTAMLSKDLSSSLARQSALEVALSRKEEIIKQFKSPKSRHQILSKALRQVDELVELVKESERMEQRYEDQSLLLKKEIRELQRAQKREGANLEYLKNIIITYMSSSDQLNEENVLPVISLLLQFDRDEVERVKRAINERKKSWITKMVYG